MPKRFTDRPVKVGDILSAEMINSLIVPLDNSIAALEGVVIDWQAQIDLFNSQGLKRISSAIQPLLDQIYGAINGGLLVADTTDTIGFVQGDDINLLIASASRVTFQPTSFVMLTHPSAAADWALCRVTDYIKTTGVISLEVLTLHGSGSSRTGWVVSASAGLADTILNAAVSAGASAAAAAQSAEDAGAAAILIAGGPVSTVNGRAGIVTGLAEASDVYTKTAADLLLADKADVVTTYTKTEVDALVAGTISATDVRKQIHSLSLFL